VIHEFPEDGDTYGALELTSYALPVLGNGGSRVESYLSLVLQSPLDEPTLGARFELGGTYTMEPSTWGGGYTGLALGYEQKIRGRSEPYFTTTAAFTPRILSHEKGTVVRLKLPVFEAYVPLDAPADTEFVLSVGISVKF
jgi:hypothetical protein